MLSQVSLSTILTWNMIHEHVPRKRSNVTLLYILFFSVTFNIISLCEKCHMKYDEDHVDVYFMDDREMYEYISLPVIIAFS